MPLPDRRIGWLVGILLTAVAAFGVVGNLNLPWLAVPAGTNTTRFSFWDDLRSPGALPYEQRLLLWPLAACALTAAAGALMYARAFLPPRGLGLSGALLVLSTWITAYAGLLLSLTGTRWLGFQWARELDTGPSTIRLHAAPHLNLAIGMTLLVGAAWGVARQARPTSRSLPAHRLQLANAAAAALGLLILPILPFAKLQLWGGTQIWIDEFTMAVLGAQESFWSLGAPRALGLARLMVWGTLYASVISCLVAQTQDFVRLPRGLVRLRHAAAANAVFVAAALGFAGRFYERLPHLRDGAAPVFNPVLPLVLIVLAALSAWYVIVLRRQAEAL